ncbi:MAG TPA: hemerythrin domain-containing protein [Virgibacillus sp.]|nr:hemerythrin domain-containing protein [Virgibacillus sp.]
MTRRRKGIKRHESLKPLSRHHMIALHLALKLKRAGTDKSLLTKEEIKQEVQAFWEPDGQQHFREEEEILLTTFALHASVDRPEISEMLIEHVQIRALINQIIKTDTIAYSLMHELGMILEQHVRKEERVIFPMIEKALPEHVLEELAPYLH